MSRLAIFLVMLCTLVSCGGGYRAPVEGRQMKPQSVPYVYAVQRGDTLYSITWRYGLDYRSVAAANGVAAPYTIYPGQQLYLTTKAPGVASRPVPAATPPATATSRVAATGSSTPTAKPIIGTTPKPIAKTASKPAARITAWRWPTSGKVTRGYSSTVHKGIDISGKQGDPIYAVAPGKVVYAGTGIVGYGELLIVKHNDIYLSAYGHNYRLLVDEGEQVKSGQKIAEKGSSGTDTVKLHFEIRKEGKPVDPQKLLP